MMPKVQDHLRAMAISSPETAPTAHKRIEGRTGRILIAWGIAMNSPSSNRSIPELFSDAVGQLAKLVGNEFELARAELSEKASQVGRAAAMIGAGAVVLMPALVLLLFAVSAGLIRGGF